MDTQPHSNCCPKCQTPLPVDAPQGLCPKCLLAAVATPTDAGQPAGRPAPPAIGEIAAAFPQLEIIEFIGQGGMGFVFKARQPKLDRLVALKILPQSLAADPTFAERFNREARLLARLNHPGIVTVHDFGVVGQASCLSGEENKLAGSSISPATSSPNQTGKMHVPLFYYLLMEFVDGVNLRQAMQAGRFTPDQALAIVPKICEALQFAHNEGILHRDIKPENILLDAKGRVKIADFGIAKLVERGSPSRSTSDTPNAPGFTENPEAGDAAAGQRPALHALTESGRTLGTPNYMAPEQLENSGDVDHRADIYSLGVVFYEMLTGELPTGRFAPPSQKSAADPRVDEVVLRALEKEKARRYASAEEVRTQVETIATGSSRREEAQTDKSEIRNPKSGTSQRFSHTATPKAVWISAIFAVLLLVIYFVLHNPWSGVGSAGAVLETSELQPITQPTRSPGLSVWRWKCSIPSNQVLSFTMVFNPAGGVPKVNEELSSTYRTSSSREDIVYEVSVQDGAEISAEMKDFVRWNWRCTFRNSSCDAPPQWMRKGEWYGYGTPGRDKSRVVIYPGQTNKVVLRGRSTDAEIAKQLGSSIEMQISLTAVPQHVTFEADAPLNNGTDWLKWGRKSADFQQTTVAAKSNAVATTSGKENLYFGPVNEWVVTNAIDFDTRRTGKSTQSGIDAVADVSQTNSGLWGIQMRAVVNITTNDWDSWTAQQVSELAAGFATKERPPEARTLLGAYPSPTSFLFQTREGGTGLLQITGFTENPRGVKLRYKLVQDSSSAQINATNSSHASKTSADTDWPSRDYYLSYAWDVSYNLTTNVASLDSRWQLLLSAISKLRDEGLKKYPEDVMIYRELAWLFQHRLGLQKVGEGLAESKADPDQIYLRYKWAKLVERAQADGQLESQLKLDPQMMKAVEKEYGPLDWRLPEPNAIYWCYRRLHSKPALKGDDFKSLQRVIWQSLQISYQRGKLVGEPTPMEMKLERNLDLVSKVNASYEQQIAIEGPGSDMTGNIRNAQRNCLRDAVVALHKAGRKAEACTWFVRLCEISENRPLLPDAPRSLPGTLTCEEFVKRSLQGAHSSVHSNGKSGSTSGIAFTAAGNKVVIETTNGTITADSFWLSDKILSGKNIRAIMRSNSPSPLDLQSGGNR